MYASIANLSYAAFSNLFQTFIVHACSDLTSLRLSGKSLWSAPIEQTTSVFQPNANVVRVPLQSTAEVPPLSSNPPT